MRLATWNSQTGVAPNWDSIVGLNADVLSVQESEPDAKAYVEAHEGWTCEWQVGRYRKGVAVLARDPYKIEQTERSEPCSLSTLIRGPGDSRFRFVGFWAMTPKGIDDSYPRQATDLIMSIPRDDVPSVIAGDFNASSRNAHHLTNVAALSSRSMVSAYHAFHRIEHTDAWDDPTSYHDWNKDRPFHMDYVFIPSEWAIEAVEVGTFDKFAAARLSDHVPVIVTASLK
jgi:endonuclease/exonuclease/phosphatase family metal-dependent hydrolase